MKRIAALAVGALAIGGAVSVGAIASADPPPPKVTICHRTASDTNPYVQLDVAESSVDGDTGNDNGQGDHLAEHTGPVFPDVGPDGKWGDIIPPFNDNGDPRSVSLNWNAAGIAIFENGCTPVAPPTSSTSSTSSTQPTSPTTQPTTPTTSPPPTNPVTPLTPTPPPTLQSGVPAPQPPPVGTQPRTTG